MDISSYKNKIDFGIITVREDEFKAILKKFPLTENVRGNRIYGISRYEIGNNNEYTIAIVRCIEQGTGEAQDVARDMIEDLSPKWIILAGIAGGVPEHEFSLGDVVLSTKLSDFCLEAIDKNNEKEYGIGGGPIHKEIQILLAHLPALESQLGEWNSDKSIDQICPSIDLSADKFYGDSEYVEKLKKVLIKKFDKHGKALRPPKYTCAPIASSDRLIKSTDLISKWKTFSRHIISVEMELAGVYRAARRLEKDYPILSIRGISDIIGLKREHDWTEYACNTAAAFTKAFVNLKPFDPIGNSVVKTNLVFEKKKTNLIKKTEAVNNLAQINIDEYLNNINKSTIIDQYITIFNTIKSLLLLSLNVFIITTIRFYEEDILNETIKYRKKIIPIKKIISENFRKPSYKTIITLADRCYHLIDSNAPYVLSSMKLRLDKDFKLKDIGDLLDDLEKLFPKKNKSVKYIEKHKTTKNFLKFVLPEIASYSNKSNALLKKSLISNLETNRLSNWKNALKMINDHFSIFLNNEFILKKLDKVDPTTGNYIIVTTTYSDDTKDVIINEIPLNESEEFQTNITGMSIGDGQYVHLYPFLLIKDDALFYYRRTLAAGYEYYSIIDERIFIKETKKKFNHSVFKRGSKQELFWTDVIPTVNTLNNIKANIPDEGLSDTFVGRKKQKKLIRDEIIEIPNQNGIIYGPGGIGKTALMLQISEELFEEENHHNVIFDNIIWVSAKSDYYDHIFNIVEPRNPQFKSLDGVITSILNFFEIEGLEEYNFEDRKELVLELLEDNKILLILDNLESVSNTEADKIVKYFDTDVKRKLRRKPDFFKIIITSRRQIPSGFHQIELKGLDLRESKQLVESLYDNYQTSKPELTNQQKEKLYEATKGIPVVIKHCFAKHYEFNESLESIISKLPSYSKTIVQFSFKEILSHIEKEKEKSRIKILILLELINYPLMVRQIADILEIDELIIEDKIPTLIDYQCIKRINQKSQEKYIVNDEIRILTKSLAQKHTNISNRIKEKATKNFSIDKQMDYTTEELSIVSIFLNYLSENDYLNAEDFIKDQLKKNPKSILLNFQYAKHLKDNKKDSKKAIEILESIREISGNHSSILALLVSSYISLDIPNYEKASSYVKEIEKDSTEDETLIKIAEFYVSWSTSIKLKRELDPIKERLRQANYKSTAKQALHVINKISNKDHTIYYLAAQSYFNCWDYDNALTNIQQALNLTSKSSSEALHSYDRFLKIILKRREYYSKTNNR